MQVYKAPLRYNKDFALILQMDDGSSSIYEQVMPFLEDKEETQDCFMATGLRETGHLRWMLFIILSMGWV